MTVFNQQERDYLVVRLINDNYQTRDRQEIRVLLLATAQVPADIQDFQFLQDRLKLFVIVGHRGWAAALTALPDLELLQLEVQLPPPAPLSDLDSLLGGSGTGDPPEASTPSESDSDDSYRGPTTVDLSQLQPSPPRPQRFMDHFRRLTDAEIREMAGQARALQNLSAQDAESDPQQPPLPAVASGPPDQDEDQNQEDNEQEEEDADDDDESPLPFIGGPQSTAASPKHEVDIDDRPTALQPFMGVRLSTGEEYVWTVLPMSLASAPAIMQLWSFDYKDYHNWFREHDHRVAVDATPSQLGFADNLAALAIPLERPLPIYAAEYLAAFIAALQVPPETTVYTDNMAVFEE
ncbi:hypothetical protein FJT64_004867 [Amphibalanus amphitrite]|uniref:Uncharacterized protein n=1 Tax=Amphibalanus amphitrite TaxID=1232801 RepID=A0A6A4VSC0_AMPAM|nr:hypothetical protein FJT64_004867 [Amphibalanus amphitrite]